MVSWKSKLQDLEQHLATGAVVGSAGSSFRQRYGIQRDHAAQPDSSTRLCHTIPTPDFSFRRIRDEANLLRDLPGEHWKTTAKVREQRRADVQAIILAASCTSFNAVFAGRRTIKPFLLHCSRKPLLYSLNILRPVGWLSTRSPFCIVPDTQDGTSNLTAKARHVRKGLPWKGWVYFASRRLTLSVPLPVKSPRTPSFCSISSGRCFDRQIAFSAVGALPRIQELDVRRVGRCWGGRGTVVAV